MLLDCATAGRKAVADLCGWCFDCWYLDDGQVVLPAKYADAFLRAFDDKLTAAGGIRVAPGEFKSVARPLSHSASEKVPMWASQHIVETCKLQARGEPYIKVLGIELGADAVQKGLHERGIHLPGAPVDADRVHDGLHALHHISVPEHG